MNHPERLSPQMALGPFRTSLAPGPARGLVGLVISGHTWALPGTSNDSSISKLPSVPNVETSSLTFAPFFNECSTEAQAAVFKGEPFCFFGDCSLCLRLGKGIYGLGISAPCPLGANAEMAHLGASQNPNNCKAYRFQEIECVKGVTAGA